MNPAGIRATDHWSRRVAERCGPDVCPAQLARGITLAIEQGRTDLVEFVSRVSRTGKRLFRFRLRDGRVFFALIDTDAGTLVTVLPTGYVATRQDRPALVVA